MATTEKSVLLECAFLVIECAFESLSVLSTSRSCRFATKPWVCFSDIECAFQTLSVLFSEPSCWHEVLHSTFPSHSLHKFTTSKAKVINPFSIDHIFTSTGAKVIIKISTHIYSFSFMQQGYYLVVATSVRIIFWFEIDLIQKCLEMKTHHRTEETMMALATIICLEVTLPVQACWKS
jgi:hypothetical protein